MARRRRKKQDSHVLGYDLSDPEQKKALMDQVSGEIKAGKPLKEALQVSQQMLDNVYALAYEKYHKGEYETAANFFRYLIVFEQDRYEYILGLAASMHRLEQFEEASRFYLLLSINYPDDPIPAFHGADCYLKMGDKEAAEVSLMMAIHVSGAQEKYAELKTRAELIVKNLGEE